MQSGYDNKYKSSREDARKFLGIAQKPAWIWFGKRGVDKVWRKRSSVLLEKAVQCEELQHIAGWSAKVWFLRDVRVDATPKYDSLWGLEVREKGDVRSQDT